MKIKKVKVGDSIYTVYKQREITKITENKLWLGDTYYLIKDIRKIKGTFTVMQLDAMIKTLKALEKEYKYVIIDLYNNIAVSNVPKKEYTKNIAKTKNKQEYYDEHIKFLYYSSKIKKEKFEIRGELKGEEMNPNISEFINKLGLFFWMDLSTSDFGSLLGTMDSFTETIPNECKEIYKETNFICG